MALTVCIIRIQICIFLIALHFTQLCSSAAQIFVVVVAVIFQIFYVHHSKRKTFGFNSKIESSVGLFFFFIFIFIHEKHRRKLFKCVTCTFVLFLGRTCIHFWRHRNFSPSRLPRSSFIWRHHHVVCSATHAHCCSQSQIFLFSSLPFPFINLLM
jgi:hypothetical protein